VCSQASCWPFRSKKNSYERFREAHRSGASRIGAVICVDCEYKVSKFKTSTIFCYVLHITKCKQRRQLRTLTLQAKRNLLRLHVNHLNIFTLERVLHVVCFLGQNRHESKIARGKVSKIKLATSHFPSRKSGFQPTINRFHVGSMLKPVYWRVGKTLQPDKVLHTAMLALSFLSVCVCVCADGWFNLCALINLSPSQGLNLPDVGQVRPLKPAINHTLSTGCSCLLNGVGFICDWAFIVK